MDDEIQVPTEAELRAGAPNIWLTYSYWYFPQNVGFGFISSREQFFVTSNDEDDFLETEYYASDKDALRYFEEVVQELSSLYELEKFERFHYGSEILAS